MKRIAKRFLFSLLGLTTLFTAVGCGGKGLAKYNGAEDAPFLPKDIYSEKMHVPGLIIGGSSRYFLQQTGDEEVGALVLRGEYGKCYEIKIPKGTPEVYAAKFTFDPASMSQEEVFFFEESKLLCNKDAPEEEVCFMYTCRTDEEYVVIYTGKSTPVYIGERNIIAETDTEGPWYYPSSVGSISGDKTLGDISWTSDEVIENLYEPVRERHPDYITRNVIGKEATGQYDMYCYVYEPEDYEITVFLTGGIHGDEQIGYFSLAKIMQMIADADKDDALLYTMREKVRFVVIPIVNVWSVSNGHIRKNSAGQDLNRDFEALSQAESQNVAACFEAYARDAVVAMDFHISVNKDVELWFNFINYTDNAVANYKTTNHMYHRYLALGHTNEKTDLSKLPGSYTKGGQYLEGFLFNQYGVPTITVEYTDNAKMPPSYSDACMTLAVETYINFIIQNSLFYLQGK